jgi:hypothetical protein
VLPSDGRLLRCSRSGLLSEGRAPRAFCLQRPVPLSADCVEEVGSPSVWDVARNQARVSLFALRPALGGQRDQLCQLSEVLDRGSEEELVLSTGRTAQPEPVDAQDALEMCEQHLDASYVHTAMSRRSQSWRCRAQRLGHSRRLNAGLCGGGHFRTATRLKLAGVAVMFAGAIEQCCPSFTRVPVEHKKAPDDAGA